jgi:hypothetical protein
MECGDCGVAQLGPPGAAVEAGLQQCRRQQQGGREKRRGGGALQVVADGASFAVALEVAGGAGAARARWPAGVTVLLPRRAGAALRRAVFGPLQSRLAGRLALREWDDDGEESACTPDECEAAQEQGKAPCALEGGGTAVVMVTSAALVGWVRRVVGATPRLDKAVIVIGSEVGTCARPALELREALRLLDESCLDFSIVHAHRLVSGPATGAVQCALAEPCAAACGASVTEPRAVTAGDLAVLLLECACPRSPAAGTPRREWERLCALPRVALRCWTYGEREQDWGSGPGGVALSRHLNHHLTVRPKLPRIPDRYSGPILTAPVSRWAGLKFAEARPACVAFKLRPGQEMRVRTDDMASERGNLDPKVLRRLNHFENKSFGDYNIKAIRPAPWNVRAAASKTPEAESKAQEAAVGDASAAASAATEPVASLLQVVEAEELDLAIAQAASMALDDRAQVASIDLAEGVQAGLTDAGGLASNEVLSDEAEAAEDEEDTEADEDEDENEDEDEEKEGELRVGTSVALRSSVRAA